MRSTSICVTLGCCALLVACQPVQAVDRKAKAGCADLSWLVAPDNLTAAPYDVKAHADEAVSLLQAAAQDASRYQDLAGGAAVVAKRVEADGYTNLVADAALATVLLSLTGEAGCGKWGF